MEARRAANRIGDEDVLEHSALILDQGVVLGRVAMQNENLVIGEDKDDIRLLVLFLPCGRQGKRPRQQQDRAERAGEIDRCLHVPRWHWVAPWQAW
jgi:hypothetical protein